MKFLCDNCKTKYRIADEKAAGKTIRMKCQKCGHQIEVRAEVTETSVVSSMPPATKHLESKPAPRPSLATSLATQKPRPSQVSAPPGSALAGAFQKSVQSAPPPSLHPGASSLDVGASDEWYVAINGVPVGPVRISEIRRKAASGTVTEESLCWQEGLEEWRPIRSVPELAAIVREAAQGNRPSLTGPVPAEVRTPGGGPPPRPPQRSAPAAPRPGVTPPRAPAPRSNVVAFQGRTSSIPDRPADERSVTSAPAFGAVALATPAITPAPSPVATPAPGPIGIAAPAPLAASAPAVVADPFAADPFAMSGGHGLSAPVDAATPALVTTDVPFASAPPATSATPSLVSPPPAKERPVPLWFWLVLAFVVPFGIMAAYLIFRAPQQPVVVQAPAATATEAPTAPPAVAPVAQPEPEPEPLDAGADLPATGTSGKSKAVATNATKPTGGNDRKTVDVSGLLGGAGGPATSGGAGAGGGGGLDSSSVERVVRERSASVKRTCWERSGTTRSSANVTVAVTVAPNGSVSGANATGDDPIVGKCIENQVRGWTFPAPGSSTTVNIPFHFFRQ